MASNIDSTFCAKRLPDTRVKKKERYQQLLDAEEQLRGLVAARSLQSRRLENVKKFLSLRQQMIAADAMKGELGASVTDSSLLMSSLASRLEAIVEEISAFQFQYCCSSSSSPTALVPSSFTSSPSESGLVGEVEGGR